MLSLILSEEYRLRVFENRVLRRIFGPKRDEVTGERRKLHNKGLHDLYSFESHAAYKKKAVEGENTGMEIYEY
jgi:hypothetical protein